MVLSWAGVLLFTGIWTATRLPLEWTPDLKLPEVTVTASWHGAAPRAMERHVTTRLERSLRGLPGVAALESHSAQGRAYLRLETARGQRPALFMAALDDRLRLARKALPPDVVLRVDESVPEELRREQGFMTIQLLGPVSREALGSLAVDRVAPRLRGLPGVAGATVRPLPVQELLVIFDPARLQAHGLTSATIRQELRRAADGTTYGRWRGRGESALLIRAGEDRVEGFRELVLTSAGAERVTLGDVAEIELGTAPETMVSRIDGHPVIAVELDRAPGSDLLAVSRSVHRTLAELADELPWGVQTRVAEDRGEQVGAELGKLARQGALGLVLVIVVLALVLGSVRAVAAVVLAAAVALAPALILMPVLGLSLNLLTLAGLVLVTGLLVDNGVVIVEALRGARGGAGPKAIAGVAAPLAGASLTTVAILGPFVYLSGDLRGLFMPFAVLTASTLLFSLLSSTLVIPALLGQADAPRECDARERGVRRSWYRVLTAPYSAAARFPSTALALLVLVVGLPVFLLPDRLDEPSGGWRSEQQKESARRYNATLGSEPARRLRLRLDPLLGGVSRLFFTRVDLGSRWDFDELPEVRVRLELPSGSGSDRADGLLRGFEEIAVGWPEVHRVFATVGGERADLRVQFLAEALKKAAPFELRHRLIERATKLAGIEVSVFGLLPRGYYGGLGGVVGYRLTARGSNFEQVREIAQQFAERLRRYPRVAAVDIHAGSSFRIKPRKVLRLSWGTAAAVRSGLAAKDLLPAFGPYLASGLPAFLADVQDTPDVPVRLVMAGAENASLDELTGRPLALGRDGFRLAGLADIAKIKEPAVIERREQQYVRYIRVFYRGPGELAEEMLERELAAFDRPAGYHLERPDDTFMDDEAQRQLLFLLAATAFFVFLIMAAVLESWRLPGLVMLTLPLAFPGVGLGFIVLGAPFAEGAFIGLILLVGIAVNDGILLVDRYRRLRRSRPGTAPRLLARLAVRQRLRPMWATTASSVAGMLPLLIFADRNDFWLGLAVTVMGGLLSSTLLAPMAVVALLSRHGRA